MMRTLGVSGDPRNAFTSLGYVGKEPLDKSEVGGQIARNNNHSLRAVRSGCAAAMSECVDVISVCVL